MSGRFVIDSLPSRASAYAGSHVVVAADVFRATTTLVTAVAGGHDVYPVASAEEALELAARLHRALLVGEQGGLKPDGFDLNNSPTAVAALSDTRPVVLLSSSGTRLLVAARSAAACYAVCLRNLSATAIHVSRHHGQVALIAAGTQGQARDEDEVACALLGRRLMAAGFSPEDPRTAAHVEYWSQVPLHLLSEGPSAAYLRRTGQAVDIEFVLGHIDDLNLVAMGVGPRLVGLKVSADTAAAAVLDG